MNKQEQIKILERELELAENYPFNKNRHNVAECLVERGIYFTPECKNITTRNPVDEFICSECGFQYDEESDEEDPFCKNRITRPPQSWCYVEKMSE